MKTSYRNDRHPSLARGRLRGRTLSSAALALGMAVGLTATTAYSSGAATLRSARVASSSAKRQTDVANVTLHIGDQAGSGSESLLKAAGLLDKLPFKADWSDFTSGPPMLQAEAAGSIDVGGVGDAPPVFAASGGARIAVVEALGVDPNAAALLVPKGSTITAVSQLKGKTIAVAQGSSADYHLLVTLTKAGLSVKDVTLDYLQPAEGLAALTSGKVDAWDVWTPYIEEVVDKDGARVLVNGAGIGTTYSFVVASRAALADPAKVAAISDYLAAITKAYVWEKTHPSAWAATWSAATGVPLNIMENATKDDIDTPLPITPSVIGSEQGVVDAFYSAGLIPAKINFANYSYSGFASTIKANS